MVHTYTLYHGFAGFVPSGREAVFPEFVHKPWQSGKQYYQTAMVCEHTLEKQPPSQKEQNWQNQGIMLAM